MTEKGKKKIQMTQESRPKEMHRKFTGNVLQWPVSTDRCSGSVKSEQHVRTISSG